MRDAHGQGGLVELLSLLSTVPAGTQQRHPSPASWLPRDIQPVILSACDYGHGVAERVEGEMTGREQTDPLADTVANESGSAVPRVHVPDTVPLPGAQTRGVEPTDEPDLVSQPPIGLGPPPEGCVDPVMRDQVLSAIFPSLQLQRRKIDRFPILDRLGSGGMGVVYSGYDEELDRRIAIKLVRSPDAGHADVYAKRLLQEARVMARLTHPNVVQVYQTGPSEDGTFIAMEFIQGQTLADWLEASEKRSWREVVDIFVQAGRGLAAAHAAGIVHRDFKPANAMIDHKGIVKVLDFGLARDACPREPTDAGTNPDSVGSKGHERLTQTGAVMGTPAYMSPEQLRGHPPSPRSDQYNFSVALYQGLYGERPFPTIAMAMLSGAVPTPPENHGVPDWVHQLVLRGLSSDPERRHESMDTLLDALERDPIARRRRLVGIGTAAFGIGLSGFLLASVLKPPQALLREPQSCAGANDAVAGVWSPERREAIGRALESTNVGHAAEVWGRVAPQLEDYSKDWADMSRDACEAHLGGHQSDTLFDRRTACLDQHLATLSSVLDQLDEAKPELVDELPKAVANLPPIDHCGDLSALLDDGIDPPDPAAASEVQQLRERVAAAKSYELLGQFDEGLEPIETVVAQAKDLGYAPLEAEALLQQGYLQQWSSASTPKETLATLRAAKLRAIGANHLEVAAAAASRHALLRGDVLGEVDAALEEAEEVQAYLKQLPDAEALRGVHLNDFATLLGLEGEHPRAVELFQDSLAVKRAAFGERHHEVAFTLYNLALVYMEQSAFRHASTSLAEAQAIAVETLGPNHPNTVTIMTEHAKALIERHCRSEARELLERVLAARTDDAFHPRYMMARLELLARDHVTARAQAERALELAETEGSTVEVALSLQLLAEVELAEGHGDLAFEPLTRALDLVRADYGEEHRLYANSLRQLAEAERIVGHHERTIERSQHVLTLLEGRGLAESTEAYWTMWTLGRARADAGRMAEASSSFESALVLREKQGITDDDLSRARLELERSNALLELDRVEEAEVALEYAMSTFEDGCEDDSLELASSRFGLARALMRLEVTRPERAEQLSQLASSALARRGEAFAEEAAQVDAWRREMGWS